MGENAGRSGNDGTQMSFGAIPLVRFRRLGRLRWYAAAALVGVALFLRFALKDTFAWRALLVLAGAIVAYTTVFRLVRVRLERSYGRPLPFRMLERFTACRIALDLIILMLIIHFTGGLENPFVILCLIPPVIASVLLTPGSAYLLGGLATLLLLGMGVCEAAWPSLHHPVSGYLTCKHYSSPLFIAGEVGALSISIFVAVYFISSIAKRLHRRERQLLEARDSLTARSEEIAKTNQVLSALEEQKSRFLSLAAHQLRGPLAVVETCLATVCDGYAPDVRKQGELLGRARVRVRNMLDIVSDLLTLARTNDFNRPSSMTPVTLDKVAEQVVNQNLDFAASRQTSLVFSPDAGGALVLGDERALADAIGNLVSNAVKYTDEGGHVKVVTRLSGAEVVCEVIDDGIGIPEKEKGRLFEDFFRASNARASENEGTGLGLSIAREIVRKCGGRLTIESLEHLGTCAMMSFPLLRREAKETELR